MIKIALEFANYTEASVAVSKLAEGQRLLERYRGQEVGRMAKKAKPRRVRHKAAK